MICSSVCPSFGTLALLIGRSRSSTAYDNSTFGLYMFWGFGSAPAQLRSRRHRSTNCKTVGRIIASNIPTPDTGSRNAIKSQTLRPMLSDSASDPPCNPPASLSHGPSPAAGVDPLEQEELVQLSVRRVIAMAPGCAQFQTARSLAKHDLHFVELSVVRGLSRIVAKNVLAPNLSAQFVNSI